MQATGSDTDGVAATLEAVSGLQAVRAEAGAGLFELAADAGRHLPVLLAPLPPGGPGPHRALPACARTRGAGSRAERAWATRSGNLAPLGRHAHRIKTHGSWTVRQPFEGIYLWRDPHGQLYLVDHTGTHPLTRPGHPPGRPAASTPTLHARSECLGEPTWSRPTPSSPPTSTTPAEGHLGWGDAGPP